MSLSHPGHQLQRLNLLKLLSVRGSLQFLPCKAKFQALDLWSTSGMPVSMMIRRLRVNTELSDDDAHALQELPSTVKEFPEEYTFVREGDRPTQCCVIMS